MTLTTLLIAGFCGAFLIGLVCLGVDVFVSAERLLGEHAPSRGRRIGRDAASGDRE